MELGWLDICLRVRDVAASRTFYEKLGFSRVEGADEQGWAVVVNDVVRLGLFEARYMGDDALSLNFRGGDVYQIVQTLQREGCVFDKERANPDGTGSAELRDPDGHLIFLDAGVDESKKV